MLPTPTEISRSSALPSAKWREAADAGFQILPDMLLKHQKALGLNATDMVVLINLTSFWWYAEKLPFPRSRLIAQRMGADVRTVQRSLAKLQELGLVERITADTGAGEQTVFSLEGLVRELSKYARRDLAYRPRPQVAADAAD